MKYIAIVGGILYLGYAKVRVCCVLSPLPLLANLSDWTKVKRRTLKMVISIQHILQKLNHPGCL